MTPHPDHFDFRHFDLLRHVQRVERTEHIPYHCTPGLPLMIELEKAGYVLKNEHHSGGHHHCYNITQAGTRLLRVLGE